MYNKYICTYLSCISRIAELNYHTCILNRQGTGLLFGNNLNLFKTTSVGTSFSGYFKLCFHFFICTYILVLNVI